MAEHELPWLAPLPAPRLTATPAHPVYVVGEAVALTCSIPGAPTLATVQFSKDGGELPSPVLSSSPTLQLARVGTGHAGAYSCRYRRRESGREISSPRSGAVAISVLVPPAAPQLSVSPSHPGYISGDSVTLTCSAPGGHTLSRIQFLKDGQNLDSQMSGPDPLNLSRALRLPPLAPSHSGAYSCGYWFLESGREIPSGLSHPVRILVLGECTSLRRVALGGEGEKLLTRLIQKEAERGDHPPPQPALSVDPPSGVVSEGLPLLITCAAPGDTSKRMFHFYSNGVEIVRGDTGSDISTTEPSTGSMNFSVLSIPRAGPNNTGKFSCGYEANMSGRWIPSPRSQAVNVTVTAWSLPVPLVAGCGGAATALALLVLICLCRKKTAASCRLPTSYGKSQELRRSRMRRSSDNSGVNMCGVVAETQLVYVNIPFRAGTGE
nr:basement membrane-specific heparan sulfate proteoglycan core protein-like [Chrysemys picta bellii]